jgi:hypothetical protein
MWEERVTNANMQNSIKYYVALSVIVKLNCTVIIMAIVIMTMTVMTMTAELFYA